MVYLQTFPGFVFFAANPMRHSIVSTFLEEAVLSASPRLRHDDKATLEAHANSRSDKLLLGAKTIPPQTIKNGVGIFLPVFYDIGRNLPAPSMRGLRCRNPTDSDAKFRRFARISRNQKRNCAIDILWHFRPILEIS